MELSISEYLGFTEKEIKEMISTEENKKFSSNLEKEQIAKYAP